MNIAIIGSGYVGLTTGACFSELGNKVFCVDNDLKKIKGLKNGLIPIYEPGLEELITRNVRKKRLIFTSSIKDAVRSCKVIFITVGTPVLDNGEANLSYIENVAASIAVNLPASTCPTGKHQAGMNGYRLIVEKSTVPVETGEWVKHIILANVKGKVRFDVASNPEFLREGQAINDFMNPNRIVIGVESKIARDLLSELYKPFNAPLVITNIKSAELIKHASNAFLATKISFINAISRICDKVGADVEEVAKGMGLDKRIGLSFLKAGIGYGGSCFPKDLDAFVAISDKLGYDFKLLKSVKKVNIEQLDFVFQKIKDSLSLIKGKTIGVLGLAFKPNTDDIRNSAAIGLIKMLQKEGAKIKAYDPQAIEKSKQVLAGVTFCPDAYAACLASDCLLIATEWDEFKELDFSRIKELLKRPLIIDGRNLYEAKAMSKLGFSYISIGRKNI
ncbi:MAG: UDP-glucose/GDP-mannose dehydrogenase family protein [Candidatus Omnitrophica bacterium]|nr:UDP-glucose/GDP-mannose dehydrogenase family protein [Candidatus Omnitrophota bacterium]